MDQNLVESIYKQIEGLVIELDPDPTVLGPSYIVERIATCRNYLNSVSQIRQRIGKERRELKRVLSTEEHLLTLERDNLLATNEVVRKQPNIKDREAVANTMLHDRLVRISQLKAELLDIDNIEAPVRMVHEELIRASSEIKVQRTMIMADRTSGSGYGDESPGKAKRFHEPLPEDSGVDEAELDRIMQEHTPLVSGTSQSFRSKVEVPSIDSDMVESTVSDLKGIADTSLVEVSELTKPKESSLTLDSGVESEEEVMQFLTSSSDDPTLDSTSNKAKEESTVEGKPEVSDDEDLMSLLLNL